jgi:foldase protein PrsA
MAPEGVILEPPDFTACLAHQERVAPGVGPAELKKECRQRYRTLRQQVVEFLISSHWLIAEATGDGLEPTQVEVREAARANPGRTLADATFIAEAELSSARIAQALDSRSFTVTPKQVYDYYERNIERFERPEERDINIIEHLHSPTEASKVMSRVKAGASMSQSAIHESFLKRPAEFTPAKRAILEAIFAAKPHALVGPLPLNELWCFFEVSRVVPRVVQPLTHVYDTVARQLAREERRQALSRFIAAWRMKWTARTSCSGGYVVQKCWRYKGQRTAEDPLSLS